MRADGNGGHSGTCLTRSRQVWRSFGDSCDQRWAFFKKSCFSVALMPANSVNARMHLERCAGGNSPNVSSVFSICRRSASDKVLSVFFFSSGVSSKNWLNWAVIF